MLCTARLSFESKGLRQFVATTTLSLPSAAHSHTHTLHTVMRMVHRVQDEVYTSTSCGEAQARRGLRIVRLTMLLRPDQSSSFQWNRPPAPNPNAYLPSAFKMMADQTTTRSQPPGSARLRCCASYWLYQTGPYNKVDILFEFRVFYSPSTPCCLLFHDIEKLRSITTELRVWVCK